MTVIHFHQTPGEPPLSVESSPGESLLDALLRHNYEIPFGCKGGVCQSCIMQSVDGAPPSSSQPGLTPAQIEQGLFLSCSCTPETPMRVSLPDIINQGVKTKVLDKIALNDNIFRLRLENAFSYHAGQFVTLWKDTATARSYSLASVDNIDPFLEFHIKRISGGAFSEWAWEHLAVGDLLTLQGPLGKCFYHDSEKENPLLLLGIGTGLAPLIGILRDALSQQHSNTINLVIGGKDSNNFYLVDDLLKIAENNPNLTVHFIAQELATPIKGTRVLSRKSDIYQYTKDTFPDLKDHTLYVCGAESFVQKIRKQCFLSGAAMQRIHADPFIPSGA